MTNPALLSSRLWADENDLAAMRRLLTHLGDRASVVDFEERLLQPTLRQRVRLWLHRDRCAAFAWVDDYANLWFELDPELRSPALEDQVVAHGVELRRQTRDGPEPRTLDASCEASDTERLALLARHGFRQSGERSLRFARSLDDPLPDAPLPDGFELRPVLGECEVEALVALHRVCFETENMTVEARQAMMQTPSYVAELDTVAVAPNGELAGFCVGGIEGAEPGTGYTDPIGVHPNYRRRGLGRAMVVAVLGELRQRGVGTAEVGTSSENVPMCRLAESLGFGVVSERWWFTLEIDR